MSRRCAPSPKPRLASCQGGVTAIEFAIVTPILFLLLMAMIEFSLIFFTYAALEGATGVGARLGKTGFMPQGVNRETYIRNEIQRLTNGWLDDNLVTITILSYNNFGNIGQPEPCISPNRPPCPGMPEVNFVDINGNGQWDEDQGQTNAGGPGAIVVYRVSYPWQIFTPIFRQAFGQGQIILTAVTTVRNERF
jgi:hypothetical protein